MINWLQSQLHRPENGWDPVDPAWADYYAEYEWKNINHDLLDRLEAHLGGLQGKRVLDIGAGPGQYAISFAQRGAQVVWYDISRRYQDIAQQQAAQRGVQLEWYLGYLEDAEQHLAGQQFDFIFNRGCWFYAHNDKAFAKFLWERLVSGGLMYVFAPNAASLQNIPQQARLRLWLNAYTGFKIGHPMLPPRQMLNVLSSVPWQRLEADFTDARNDVFWVWK